ncbi:MAG: hypothetical protein VX332_00100 [Pseudomonadota bacterium]|nr:hypothetical protein [Pseudomonadota bacterium]
MSDKAFTSIQCSVFSDLAAGNVGRVFAVDDTSLRLSSPNNVTLFLVL